MKFLITLQFSASYVVSGFSRTVRRSSHRRICAAIVGLIALLPQVSLLARSDAVCDLTPIEDRLPEVIAAMAGHFPVWLVEGDFGRWSGSNAWVKSAWVLSRKSGGALQVSGRRLDGPGALTFRYQDDSATSVLRVSNPLRWSMIPGGASAEVMKDYAFIGSAINYSSPGCWELTATLGDQEVHIVRNLKH